MRSWRRRWLEAAAAATIAATMASPTLALPARSPAAEACELGFRGSGPPLGLGRSGLSGMSDHGDLAFGSGFGKLPGLRFPQPSTEDAPARRAARAALLAPFLGQPPSGGAETPDRWGRHAVELAGPDGGPSLSLVLLRAGEALAWPADLPAPCRAPYLEAERTAMRARLGLWSASASSLLDAGEGASVAARAGAFAVMRGRVTHVGQTRRAAYLNFGARGAGASAELSLAAWRELERQGWTRDRMKGQNVTVRGVVSEARPARMLVADAASVDVDRD
jgi:hypothetical protein